MTDEQYEKELTNLVEALEKRKDFCPMQLIIAFMEAIYIKAEEILVTSNFEKLHKKARERIDLKEVYFKVYKEKGYVGTLRNWMSKYPNVCLDSFSPEAVIKVGELEACKEKAKLSMELYEIIGKVAAKEMIENFS